MAAEAEAEITKNDGNASQIKDSAVARLGFQSAAALLRAHGGGRAEPSRDGGILSPRFRSAAAMAGWDEEALLLASLVVEDTPVREGSKHKKRSAARVKSPPTTNSQRKRRSRRQSPPIPPVTLSLDDEETTGEVALVPDPQKTETEAASSLAVEKEKGRENDVPEAAPAAVTIPCMQRLREELSCAICLDICFEPSTTPCGHSFCKKCLKCAATKCGKRCPKCRELIGNGRSCTVNTVLWNTIQLLFPEEIEARKKASPASSRCKRSRTSSPGGRSSNGSREADSSTRNANIIGISSRRRSAARAARLREGEESVRRTTPPNQSEDAALALRLQREEFMEAFRETQQPHTITASTYSARANLRAMASRAIQMRIRRRS